MIPVALPQTDLLASIAPVPATTDGIDSKFETAPVCQGETLQNQFSALVKQYSEEAPLNNLNTDSVQIGLKQPDEVGQAEEKPVKKIKPEGKGFSGTWQLLLDILDHGLDSCLPVVLAATSSSQNVVQKAAEELTLTDAATAQLKTPQQAAPQNVNVSQVASVLEQVASAIVSAVGGSNRLVVRLHPPDLGTVTVKVTRADGKVSVAIETTDSNVQSILARGAGDLRDSLKAQGVNINRFDVTNGENKGEKDGRESKHRRSTVAFQIEFASLEGE